MLNKYPVWAYLLIVLVIAVGGLYALPNVYGEDPALQISGQRGAAIEPQELERVQKILVDAEIPFKSLEIEEGTLLVRLLDSEAQLAARQEVIKGLGTDYVVALNLAPATPAWLKGVGAEPMKLGLDLRGGVHFLMEVDMEAALEKAQAQMITDFRSDLREAKILGASVRESSNGVMIRFRQAEDLEQGKRLLSRNYTGLNFTELNDGISLAASMSEQRLKETRDYAIQQNVTILRNRVNELGVAEPLIQRQGAERIVVELPGIQDTARAKEILGATATLEFRMVDSDNDLRDALEGRIPPGSQLLTDRSGRPQLLKRRVILTGDHIVDANSGFDEYSRPQVNIKLDGKGGNKMARATKDNIGQPMATVFIEYKNSGEVDEHGKVKLVKHEEVINVATIQSRLGRSFRITGIDSQPEAHNLALLLRAGALIAPIQIVEERTIGPSLGQENIDRGKEAIGIGFFMVVIFMAIYYRKFGLVANTALLANLLLILGVMSMIPGATLTLPGMAGIVLTVGMAVDANVLIFERIREELRDGRSPQHAINQGYGNALSTIADANITTFITALILFAVGTGPIRGFSVTLMIGIATSMFTAIIVTRAIVNSVWGGKRLQKLSI